MQMVHQSRPHPQVRTCTMQPCNTLLPLRSTQHGCCRPLNQLGSDTGLYLACFTDTPGIEGPVVLLCRWSCRCAFGCRPV